MPDDDKAGYKRPPLHTRFKKGRSGNPSGRPKPSPTLAAEFAKALSEKVTVSDNGRHKKISRRELIVKQIMNKAATGDARSIDQFIRLYRGGMLGESTGDNEAANRFHSTAAEDLETLSRLLEEYRPPEESED